MQDQSLIRIRNTVKNETVIEYLDSLCDSEGKPDKIQKITISNRDIVKFAKMLNEHSEDFIDDSGEK